MNTIRLTRLFSFEAAHFLPNYPGGCRNIHGHSYKLEVTVMGSPQQEAGHAYEGMLIDFKELKKIVQQQIVEPLDHALILRENSPKDLIGILRQLNHKLLLTAYQPTCENMLLDFKTKLKACLPNNVRLHSLKLWETQNAFASWHASDNE